MSLSHEEKQGGMPQPARLGGPPSARACLLGEKRPGHATPESGGREKRRGLLEAAVRWPVLGAIGLVAGRLFARSAAGPLDPEQQCASRGLCRGCRSLADCRSPQARMFRAGADRFAGQYGGRPGDRAPQPERR